MPRLVRLYLVNVAIGFGIAAVFLTVMLALDLGGLGRLVLAGGAGWIAGAMLFVSMGTLFAGVQFAIRIMAMAASDAPGPRGGLRQHAALVPVRVTATAKTAAQNRRR